MTQDEKIKYFQMAAGVCGITMNLQTAELLVSQYELILYKKGDTDLKSIVEVEYKIEQKHKANDKTKNKQQTKV